MSSGQILRPQKRTALVFGVTANLSFALGAMIIGFLKHNPNFDGEMVVFHEEITPEQQSLFREIFPNISFRLFDAGSVQQRCRGLIDVNSDDGILKRYSHFYFAKFEIFDLLDEFDKVIWMDVDMLVRGPLDELWQFDEFCWREIVDTTRTIQKKAFDEFAHVVEGVGYRPGNGGLIGVSKGARKKGKVDTQKAYAFFGEYFQKTNLTNGDEFSPYLMASSVGAKLKSLPLKFNCPSATNGVADAYIIHSIGKDKFWNNHALKLAYPDWWLWYNEWVRLGGAKMASDLSGGGIVKTPNVLVASARYEGHWRNLYEKIWNTLPDGFVPDASMHRRFYRVFLKHCPKKFVHIEITKLAKGFDLSLHVGGRAQENAEFVTEIAERIVRLRKFKKVDHKDGVGWSSQLDRSKLADGVCQLAQALVGLKYSDSP